MIIQNKEWTGIKDDDSLVFVAGYEKRSTYIFSLCKKTRNKENTLVFLIRNNECQKYIRDEINRKEIRIIECDYDDYEYVLSEILSFSKQQILKKATVNIDYSSMPRSWYCRIPEKISKELKTTFSMWYSAGNYPSSYEVYPSAIETIQVFSGKAIPSEDVKRYHFLGLGFDAIRAETIKTVIEPDNLICCCAYDSSNKEIKNAIYKKNRMIFQTAVLIASFQCNNFNGMINGLCGLVSDILSDNSHAILIPDGPKPLILAMSLVPSIIKKPGVTCLHIKSIDKHYKPVKIEPRGDIWGLSIMESFQEIKDRNQ